MAKDNPGKYNTKPKSLRADGKKKVSRRKKMMKEKR